MDTKIRIAIIGGSGYTGLELVKILSMHKYTDIKFVTSRTYKGMRLRNAFPFLANYRFGDLVFVESISSNELKSVDVLFLCLPPLKSMEFLKENISNLNGAVIDLGSDFRIKCSDDFKMWYGEEHILKDILPDFVYGLTEINRDEIKKSKYIANPGCYPTSVLLGLAPILKDGDLEIDTITIDSKSGATGAGRKLESKYLFCNINESFSAYSATGHRHIGEMEQEIGKISGKEIKICFTPHLLPVDRGIFTSIYCRLNRKLSGGRIKGKNIVEIIYNIYKQFYSGSYFVRFLGEKLPQLKDVVGTNMCQIGLSWDERTHTLKIFSTIDNLLKGAAGQAVQNMNVLLNIDESEGLI